MAETGVRAAFAAAVTRERRARHWSQAELARKAGIGLSTLSHVETRYRCPSLEVAALIARALGLSVGALADGEAEHG